jgi:short-subunit dehydrogenase involved in D-alanine esterification of teichoic acids
MKEKGVLILGGRSDIGVVIAHEFTAKGNHLLLAGRNW